MKELKEEEKEEETMENAIIAMNLVTMLKNAPKPVDKVLQEEEITESTIETEESTTTENLHSTASEEEEPEEDLMEDLTCPEVAVAWVEAEEETFQAAQEEVAFDQTKYDI